MARLMLVPSVDSLGEKQGPTVESFEKQQKTIFWGEKDYVFHESEKRYICSEDNSVLSLKDGTPITKCFIRPDGNLVAVTEKSTLQIPTIVTISGKEFNGIGMRAIGEIIDDIVKRAINFATGNRHYSKIVPSRKE